MELKAEKRKCGTTERYLQAVAHQFVIDPTLFHSEEELKKGGSAEQIRKLRQGLMDWLTMCHDVAKELREKKVSKEQEYVVTIAFYPIIKE